MKHILAFTLCGLIPASLALADGVGPERKMTEAEMSTFNNVRTTIQVALPKAPEGYKFTFGNVSEFGDGMLPEAIKNGQMFRMSYLATYILENDISAEQGTSYFMDKAKGTPEQQARLAELDAKDAELKKARDKTRDRAEKDRIRAELKSVHAEADSLREEIMAQYQAWIASGGAATATQELREALTPKEFSIRVLVNADVSVINKASPYRIEGTPLAFEQSEGCQDFDAYCITVLFGPFEKKDVISGYTRYKLPDTDPGVPTKARGIVLTVSGPKDKPDSVRDFLHKTDLAKLASLVP